MPGAVHLVDSKDATGEYPSTFASRLETVVFVCLVAVGLLAPLAIKGAVNAFRAAILIWIVLLITRQRKLVKQPLALPLLSFLVLTAISSAFSADPFLSWGRMRTVSLLLLAIMAGQTIRTLRQVKTLTIVLLASTILTVIYTGWQYTAGVGVQATGSDAVLASLRHFGIVPGDIIREVKGRPTRTSTQLLAQLDGPESSVKIVIWRETPDALQTFVSNVAPKDFKSALQHSDIELVRAHPPRAQGFYKHYFAFAGVLALVALLVLGIATSSTLRPRVALLAIFLGIVATLGLTLTRSYLASVIFGALVVVLIQSRRRTGWITAAAFVVLALAGLYTIQRHRVPPVSDASDPGTEYRFEMWRDSLPLVKAHPWFGVGLDSVAGDWQKWNLEAYRRFPLHSHFHSTPIQIAVECGLPALAVWMWLLVAYGLYLLRLQRALSGQNKFARGLTLGVLGGLIVFVLSGFLQYNFGDAEVMVVFWLSMGLVFALDRLAGKRDASHAGLPSLTAALQTF